MKTSLFKPQWVIMVLSMLILTLPTYANYDETEESITKEFKDQVNIGKNGTLQIEDKFGNITITHWDRPEISYRIVVTAKGNTKNLAQQRLDGVSLVEKKSGNSLSLSSKKDIIEDRIKGKNNNNNNSMPTVDYFITMPSTIALELNQEFGNISLPGQNDGNCDIRIRFGNLEAGNFNKSLKLDAQFGTIKLKDTKDAKLDVHHCGNVSMNNSDHLDIKSNFSHIKIDGNAKVVNIKNNHGGTAVKFSNKLTIDSNFGSIDIGKSNNIEIKSNHAPVAIDYVGQNLNVKNLNFGGLTVREISSGMNMISISSNHSDINLSIPSSSSFKVNAKGYKHGNCYMRGFNITSSHINETSGEYYYEVNSPKGGNVIELKSNGFGNTTIHGL